MSTNTTMPRPGSRDAPKLTYEGTDDPMKVRRYFEDLENLFSDCNITANDEKKNWTVRYPEEQVAWEWKAMNEYTNATSDYEDFKRTVLHSYPGAADEERGTMRELKRLFKKYNNISSSDLEEYLALVRRFRALKRELNPSAAVGTVEPLVTNRELVEKFTGALEPSFRSAIFSSLHIKGKTRRVPAGQKVRPDDMYDIDDVVEQGEAIVRGTMPGTDPMSTAATRASSSYTPTVHIKQEQLQQQIHDLISEKIASLMDTIKISQDQFKQENTKQMNDWMRIFQQNSMRSIPTQQNAASYENNSMNRTSQGMDTREIQNRVPFEWQNSGGKIVCFFCSEEGHVAGDCHHRNDLLKMGRIILVNGRARLPGNIPIPRQPVGAASEKDRVDYYYAEKEKREREQSRNVHLVQTTPDNISGTINTATMSTYLSNQLNERDLKIASLERELQSRMNASSSIMYQMPRQSQFSQVGWNPTGQGNNNVQSSNPMMQMFNPLQSGQNSMNNSSQQMFPTMEEFQAFVQTRRQKEEAEK
ncbi:hypothetical protein D9757_009272 [Collybiopsis confluens]|uniref:CCHC-type domain-containing protein n=1 Tax=Collybiopsis confluens TaxID=2823264 RepID=A0A8H5HAN3_9AGAR|nr:hypothetical protein D9757_009272 [Collybiopsis confluens]